jgi:hypothetical protein
VTNSEEKGKGGGKERENTKKTIKQIFRSNTSKLFVWTNLSNCTNPNKEKHTLAHTKQNNTLPPLHYTGSNGKIKKLLK